MIGQTIVSRPRFPFGALLLALFALVADVAAFVNGTVTPAAVFSLLPWLLALLLLWVRDRKNTLHFTEDSVESDRPPVSVPYAEIEAVRASGRPSDPFRAGPRAYPIQVFHPHGILRIPARLSVHSDQVFSFLHRQAGKSRNRTVHPALADYLQQKERKFGEEQVSVFRARSQLGRGKSYPRVCALCLALCLAGLGWLAWGLFRRQDEAWAVVGLFCAVIGGMFWVVLAFLPNGLKEYGKLRKSSLVVAPDGLALVQGDLQGQLRWDEIQNMRITNQNHNLVLGSRITYGIHLQVAGAVIVIGDFYDRPLATIFETIDSFWNVREPDEFEERRPRRSAPRPESEQGIRRDEDEDGDKPPPSSIRLT
jgi:hypothetical protein